MSISIKGYYEKDCCVSLESHHRCRIDQLHLTEEQWGILLEFISHNIRNGLGPLQVMIDCIERGKIFPHDLKLLEGCRDRVLAVLDTLEEMRGKQTTLAR